MAAPTARVGQHDPRSPPARAGCGPLHRRRNRPHDRHDGVRTQAPDRAAEAALARPDGRDPRAPAEAIDRPRAGVDEIAAGRPERAEERFVGEPGVDLAKRVADRSIEAGVPPIEEPPRGRRRLADEQNPHAIRPMPPPEPLATEPGRGGFARGRPRGGVGAAGPHAGRSVGPPAQGRINRSSRAAARAGRASVRAVPGIGRKTASPLSRARDRPRAEPLRGFPPCRRGG